MWNLPGLEIESVSPALAGGFLCHHGSPTGAVFKSQIPHVANYAFSVLVVPRVPLWPINFPYLAGTGTNWKNIFKRSGKLKC